MLSRRLEGFVRMGLGPAYVGHVDVWAWAAVVAGRSVSAFAIVGGADETNVRWKDCEPWLLLTRDTNM